MVDIQCIIMIIYQVVISFSFIKKIITFTCSFTCRKLINWLGFVVWNLLTKVHKFNPTQSWFKVKLLTYIWLSIVYLTGARYVKEWVCFCLSIGCCHVYQIVLAIAFGINILKGNIVNNKKILFNICFHKNDSYSNTFHIIFAQFQVWIDTANTLLFLEYSVYVLFGNF